MGVNPRWEAYKDVTRFKYSKSISISIRNDKPRGTTRTQLSGCSWLWTNRLGLSSPLLSSLLLSLPLAKNINPNFLFSSRPHHLLSHPTNKKLPAFSLFDRPQHLIPFLFFFTHVTTSSSLSQSKFFSPIYLGAVWVSYYSRYSDRFPGWWEPFDFVRSWLDYIS